MIKLILASASLGRKYLLDKLKLDYETVHTNLDEEKIISCTPINTIKLRARLKGEEALKQITDNRQQITKTNKTTTYNLKPITYLILSADTEVILNNKLFGKPSSEKEAVKMLKTLSGKTHKVVSGIYIIKIPNSKFQIPNYKKNHVNPRIPFLKADLMEKRCVQSSPRHYAEDKHKVKKPRVPEKIGIEGSFEAWSDYDTSRVTFRKLTDGDIKRYLRYTDYTRYTGGYALVASPQDFVTKVEGSISNVIGLPMEKVIPILEKCFSL